MNIHMGRNMEERALAIAREREREERQREIDELKKRIAALEAKASH